MEKFISQYQVIFAISYRKPKNILVEFILYIGILRGIRSNRIKIHLSGKNKKGKRTARLHSQNLPMNERYGLARRGSNIFSPSARS